MRGSNGFKESRSQSQSQFLGWRGTWAKFAIVAALLVSGASVQAAGKDVSEAEFRQFVVEGKIADAVQVEIGVYNSDGKMVDGTTLMAKDGVFEGTVPLPLGVKVDVRVQGYDFNGKPFAQGANSAQFNDMVAGASHIEIATKDRAARGALSITPYKLQLTSESLDEKTRQFQLSAVDAYGKFISIDPANVSWTIPYPERTAFVPCKSSGNGIACIEVNIPLRLNPYIVACMKDVICRGSIKTPKEPSGYKAISAGESHTCALAVDGRILCFGLNSLSQLARPSTLPLQTCPISISNSALIECGITPQEIACPSGETCRYTSLDAGTNHTCAIDTKQRVFCWGSNASRQIASGCLSTCLNIAIPNQVYFPSTAEDLFPKFVQVAAGEQHSCALSTRGFVYCWGNTNFGQTNSLADVTPHRVISKSKYERVSAGGNVTCAVTVDGELECWGQNQLGQIQPGAFKPPLFNDPTDMRSLHPSLVGRVNYVANSNRFTCAYAQVSGVTCWGNALLNDLTVSQAAATDIELGYESFLTGTTGCAISGGNADCARMLNLPLSTVTGSPTSLVDVAVGKEHFCAVAATGEGFCWGTTNTNGQMGDGTMVPHTLPARILGP